MAPSTLLDSTCSDLRNMTLQPPKKAVRGPKPERWRRVMRQRRRFNNTNGDPQPEADDKDERLEIMAKEERLKVMAAAFSAQVNKTHERGVTSFRNEEFNFAHKEPQYSPYSHLLKGPTFEVTVTGENGKWTWNLHDSLLEFHSLFFQAALKPNFREGFERKITLHDEDVNYFKLFVEFATYGSCQEMLTRSFDKLERTLDCYVFAEKYFMMEFRAYVMRFMHWIVKGEHMKIPSDTIYYVASISSPNSGLWKLFRDSLSARWFDREQRRGDLRKKEWHELVKHYPEFYSDVYVQLGPDFVKEVGVYL